MLSRQPGWIGGNLDETGYITSALLTGPILGADRCRRERFQPPGERREVDVLDSCHRHVRDEPHSEWSVLMGQRILWNVRESRIMPADLYRQFKEQAAARGYGPTAALARLMRRFIARGF
jgi:hypothetical protein